jgi:hypothetical protein
VSLLPIIRIFRPLSISLCCFLLRMHCEKHGHTRQSFARAWYTFPSPPQQGFMQPQAVPPQGFMQPQAFMQTPAPLPPQGFTQNQAPLPPQAFMQQPPLPQSAPYAAMPPQGFMQPQPQATLPPQDFIQQPHIMYVTPPSSPVPPHGSVAGQSI